MKMEDLRNDIPETPEFIHRMIHEEVSRQIKEEKVIDMKNRRKASWSVRKVAVAAVVGVLATSSAVFASKKIYRIYADKAGQYSVETGVNKSSDDAYTVPEQISAIRYQADYIPEGMAWNDDEKLSYTETPYMGGLSIQEYLLDTDAADVKITDKNVVAYENLTLGNRDAVYIELYDFKKDKSFNQKIYLICPEQYRVLCIYVGDDVTKEDALKFAENLQIIETGEMKYTAEMSGWSQKDYVEEGSDVFETVTSEEDVKVWAVGEDIRLDKVYGVIGDATMFDISTVSARVDSVEVYDDLSVLDENLIPEEWADICDNDGKLKANTLEYYKSGDGVNSLDDKVDTKTVNQKLVVAKVTYTNNSESTINDMLFMSGIMTLKEENGSFVIYDEYYTPGDGYDYITSSNCAQSREMPYYDCISNGDHNGSNYIDTLEAGESKTITMAWIVNEDIIDDMYLNFDGACIEFTDSLRKTGIVKMK